MTSVMLTSTPFAGHARPIRAVAAELVARGHDVRVYTARSYASQFEEVGARVVPWTRPPDFDEADLAATFPRLRARKGFRQVLINLEDLFLGTAPAQCEDLVAEWRREPWDVLAGDSMALGTRFAAEHIGCPWVTLSAVPMWLPGRGVPPTGLGLTPMSGPLGAVRDAVLGIGSRLGTALLTRRYQGTRAAAGLAPDGVDFGRMWFSPRLVVSAGVVELDYPRREPLPLEVAYVGDMTGDGGACVAGPAHLPSWWGEVEQGDLPVVHVTQGTANTDPADLIVPTLEALREEPVLVVVGLGNRAADLPGPMPANARVMRMAPYRELLPRTAVMVTNGGFGGVLQALRHDLPLVVAGGDLDKPEIAAHIGWLGAGVNLRTGTPRPDAIRAAVRRVLAEPSYRTAAARLGERIRAAGGPARAADLVLGAARGSAAPGPH